MSVTSKQSSRVSRKITTALLTSVAAVAIAAPLFAQGQTSAPVQNHVQPGGALVQQIAVRGNQRIEAGTVRSYLPVRPGETINQLTLDTSLKTLFATGLFADANITYDQGLLVVEVVENPIVNRVLYDGNKRSKEEKLAEEVQLAPRAVYTKTKVQADVQRIIEVYRRKGRFAATVTPKIVPLDQNRVDVVFEIDEGPVTGIAKVNFEGNSAYNSRELRDVVLTSESTWWNFFESNDNYDPDRLEYDRELLRQHYTKNGYADFQVLSAVAELTQDRKDFFINIQVEEGVKYNFGKIHVKSTLDKINTDFLELTLPVRTGDTFNSDKIEKATEAITYATGVSGYAFVDVNPRLTRNPENQTVDITFEVNEGPRVYVERINIKGNTTTLDRVIRREMRLVEGDAFNRVLVDRSKTRIQSLQYFGEVEIAENPGTAPDRTVLDIDVTEQSTGSFSVGIGVSSTDRFVANMSIEQRNLLGKGQYLQLDLRGSDITSSAQIRFREPYLFDRNLTGGFDLFASETDYTDFAAFKRESFGGSLNVGFPVSEIGRLSLNYTLRKDDVFLDIPSSQALSIGETFDLTQLIDPSLAPIVEFREAFLRTPSAVGVAATLSDPIMMRDVFQLNDDGSLFEDADGNNVVVGTEPVPGFGLEVSQATAEATPDSHFQNVINDGCNFLSGSLDPNCDSRGDFLTSALGYSLSFDARNHPTTPTRGWRASVAQTFAGLGGDVETIRTEMSGAYYKSLPYGFVGSLKANLGYVDSWGDDNVRLTDRFFKGASSFRGFEVAGVGPRCLDCNSRSLGSTSRSGLGQAIGGKAYAVGTAEMLLPLPLPEEYGIRASLFTDFGSVGIVDDENKLLNQSLRDANGDCYVPGFSDPDICEDRIQDEFSLRASAGLSIKWRSPFGPVQIDIAEPFLKEEYDDVEEFRFSAGGNF